MIGFALALLVATSCPVTKPNGVTARVIEYDAVPSPTSHGNAELSVGPFGLRRGGGPIVFKPGGAGFVTRGGSLGMKFGWLIAVSGPFKVGGRRLDAPAPPLWAESATGQPVTRGFHPTALIFPTPGCWEVTGRVGDVSLTFVVNVEKIGEGPSWHRDELP
jgi:hypothetical protein